MKRLNRFIWSIVVLIGVGVMMALIATNISAQEQTPAATAEAIPNALNVVFDQLFAPTSCPPGSPSGAFCLNVSGKAADADHGQITLARIAILDTRAKADANGCVPASTQGKLTIQGDSINFTATGLYCNNITTAAYIYIISGGTGKYRHATGSGIISVPPPVNMARGIGTEPWAGTLKPAS